MFSTLNRSKCLQHPLFGYPEDLFDNGRPVDVPERFGQRADFHREPVAQLQQLSPYRTRPASRLRCESQEMALRQVAGVLLSSHLMANLLSSPRYTAVLSRS